MKNTKGFVLSIEPFLDRGALLSFLTKEGVFLAFDGHFFLRHERFIPYIKETLFDITLAQGSDTNRFFLKKLTPIETFEMQGEALTLWPLVQSFIALTHAYSERSDLMFQSYQFLLQKLHQMHAETPAEKIYFYLTYTLFHALDFLGHGPLIYHYELAIQSCLPRTEHPVCHAYFAQGRLSQKHFQAIFLYLRKHWYTYFSSHTAMEIAYQCWNTTISLPQPLCKSDVISSKS